MYAKMKLLKKQLPSPRARRMDLYMVSSFLILARNTELPDWYSAMGSAIIGTVHILLPQTTDAGCTYRNDVCYLVAMQVWAQGHPQMVASLLLAYTNCVGLALQPVCSFRNAKQQVESVTTTCLISFS